MIVAIGGREPQNGRHAMRILRSYQPGEFGRAQDPAGSPRQTLAAKIPERAPRDVMRRVTPPPGAGAAAPPAPARERAG